MPLPELTTLTSGTNSPFTARSDLPATPGPDTSGDPSKRTRTIPVASEKGPDLVAQYHQDGVSVPENGNGSALMCLTWRTRKTRKTRNICAKLVLTDILPLSTCQQFLADVNFELGKLIDYEK
ncbi:uncharacterized protein LW93_3281 [Fusarium fujikuroi]|nr:uncharacterized protein LW93_3281 [Fusarium fujikuroi]